MILGLDKVHLRAELGSLAESCGLVGLIADVVLLLDHMNRVSDLGRLLDLVASRDHSRLYRLALIIRLSSMTRQSSVEVGVDSSSRHAR